MRRGTNIREYSFLQVPSETRAVLTYGGIDTAIPRPNPLAFLTIFFPEHVSSPQM